MIFVISYFNADLAGVLASWRAFHNLLQDTFGPTKSLYIKFRCRYCNKLAVTKNLNNLYISFKKF